MKIVSIVEPCDLLFKNKITKILWSHGYQTNANKPQVYKNIFVLTVISPLCTCFLLEFGPFGDIAGQFSVPVFHHAHYNCYPGTCECQCCVQLGYEAQKKKNPHLRVRPRPTSTYATSIQICHLRTYATEWLRDMQRNTKLDIHLHYI